MDKRKFLPLITLFVSVLAIVMWFQLHESTRREILAMELETRRLRTLEQEISTLKERHGELTVLAAANERRLDEARIFLPVTPAQDKFIEELYRTAELQQVRLTAVQTDEATAAEEIQSQLVNVTAEADYISVLNFIRETLDGGRLVSLENFSASSVDSNVITCELTFKIFSAPLKTADNKPPD